MCWCIVIHHHRPQVPTLFLRVRWDFTCVQCDMCTDTGHPVFKSHQRRRGNLITKARLSLTHRLCCPRLNKAKHSQLRKKCYSQSCLSGRVVKALDIKTDRGSACRFDSPHGQFFFNFIMMMVEGHAFCERLCKCEVRSPR